MLAKKYRLNRKQIGLIHKRGRRFRIGKFGVKCLPNNLGYSRFAVNVPIKVYKKAVDRNRLRRLIYDQAGKSVLAKKSFDCLLSLFAPITDEKNDIQKLFEQITI